MFECGVGSELSNRCREAVMKFILNVPYVQKEQAKAQGAHWDYAARTWYFEGETLPAGLSVWYDEPQSGGMSKRILPSSPASDPNDPYAAYLTVSALNRRGVFKKQRVPADSRQG